MKNLNFGRINMRRFHVNRLQQLAHPIQHVARHRISILSRNEKRPVLASPGRFEKADNQTADRTAYRLNAMREAKPVSSGLTSCRLCRHTR